MGYGKKVWVFPDAELPPEGINTIPGHESIIIVNTGERDANIRVTLIYTDKNPTRDLEVCVKAGRVRCLRTNKREDFGDHIPDIGAQYSILLESDEPVVAQYGRADPRLVSFYTTPGYCCD